MEQKDFSLFDPAKRLVPDVFYGNRAEYSLILKELSDGAASEI